jgi:hypothetical protein
LSVGLLCASNLGKTRELFIFNNTEYLKLGISRNREKFIINGSRDLCEKNRIDATEEEQSMMLKQDYGMEELSHGLSMIMDVPPACEIET